MKRFISVVLAVLSVAGAIWIISNRYGGGVQALAEQWCALIGVSDRQSIQIAAGIFAGIALTVSIYICYALVAQVLHALLGRRGP